jgi:hypothetical protein
LRVVDKPFFLETKVINLHEPVLLIPAIISLSTLAMRLYRAKGIKALRNYFFLAMGFSCCCEKEAYEKRSSFLAPRLFPICEEPMSFDITEDSSGEREKNMD